MLPIHFAPLQGYTEDAYRRLHHQMFGGVEAYYTPFIRLEHKEVRSKDLRDVKPEHNVGVPVVPQIIAADGEELSKVLDILKPWLAGGEAADSKLNGCDTAGGKLNGCETAGCDTADGYQRIDLNMGCPFPLQTRHGRGAGVLVHPDKVREICDVVKKNPQLSFSVKMRLGMDATDEWREVLPILNATPLAHITLHPRIATQQYKGVVDMQEFEDFMAECRHLIIYNGDVRRLSDIQQLEDRYPGLGGVMIGRGLLARPSLAMEYAEGRELPSHELLRKMKEMHSRMQEYYARIIPGEAQQLMKLRTFWDYLDPADAPEPLIDRKKYKKVKKAGNMKNYLAAVAEL